MTPNVGIEPTTTRLRVVRSTDWANSAVVILPRPIDVHNPALHCQLHYQHLNSLITYCLYALYTLTSHMVWLHRLCSHFPCRPNQWSQPHCLVEQYHGWSPLHQMVAVHVINLVHSTQALNIPLFQDHLFFLPATINIHTHCCVYCLSRGKSVVALWSNWLSTRDTLSGMNVQHCKYHIH